MAGYIPFHKELTIGVESLYWNLSRIQQLEQKELSPGEQREFLREKTVVKHKIQELRALLDNIEKQYNELY